MKVKKFFRNIAQYVPQTLVLLSVLTSNIFFPVVALAEEVSDLQSTNTQVDIPVDESEDILDEGISTSIYEEEEAYEPRFVYENGVYTVHTVVEGEEYVYPDNKDVRVRFTSVTEEGDLVIKRVELTQEEKDLLNTSDDYGWDISSSMSNGSFSYDLTLPNTQGNDVEVKYTEDGSDYESIDSVSVDNDVVRMEGLDHFTVFVVVDSPDQTKCDAVQLGTTPYITCFPTIQQAVNAADDGDTIYVAPGTYIGSYISIENKAVSLIGSGADSTIITPDTGGAVITINNSTTPMIIEGFTIDATNAGSGIFIQNSTSNVTVKNNKVINFTDKGVLISNGNFNVIDGNEIVGASSGSLAGVYLDNQAGNNTIKNNTINLATSGSGLLYNIWFSGSNSKDNIVQENTINGGLRAFQQDSGVSGTVTFKGNNIGPSEWGVSINGGNAVITENFIKDSVRPIEFSGSGEITIIDNTIDGTFYDFINIGDSFIGTLNPIRHNSFLNMGSADLHNRTTKNIDATENYWGDLDPSNNINNSGGGSIDYSPWWGEDYVKSDHSTAWTWYTNDSIQDAIDASSSGDTINVIEGTYSPFEVIGGNNLTIQATGVVTIEGVQVVNTNYGDRDAVVFVDDSTNIVLNGLIIGPNTGKTQEKDYGVIYENSSGQIKNCTVSPDTSGDMNSSGIGIWDGSKVTINACTVNNFGRIGVFIYNGCTVDILGGSIEGQIYNGEDEVCYGVEVEGAFNDATSGTGSQVVIDGVEIYNCDNTFSTEPSWVSGGVYINGWMEYYDEDDSTVTVKNCNVHNNYIGVIAIKSSSSSAQFNNIYDNHVYGAESMTAYDDSTAVFDATQNWWGSSDGPSGEGSGSGDAVSDNVEYCPWLDAENGNPVGPCLGDLLGRTFIDKEWNGLLLSSDEDYQSGMMDGFTVRLYDESWTKLAEQTTSTTGDTGQFHFANLENTDNTYYVCGVYKENYFYSPAQIGQEVVDTNGNLVAGYEYAEIVTNESTVTDESPVCWKITLDSETDGAYLGIGYTQEAPGIPTQTGYKDQNGVGYSCTGDYTNMPSLAVYWSDVSTGDTPPNDMLLYQRQYSLNGTSWSGSEIYSNPYTDQKSFGGGGGYDGVFYSRVRAFYDINNDGTYNSGEPVSGWSNVCSITHDTEKPEITLELPENGKVYSGEIDLKAVCNEDCDFINFWWREENESYSNTPPDRRYHLIYEDGTEFEWSLDTLSAEMWGGDGTYVMSDGVYYLYAAGKDLADNWARSEEVEIIVDNTPPIVEITSPEDGGLYNTDVTLSGKVTDANPHHYWLGITKDGENLNIPGITGEQSATEFTTTLTEEGVYNVAFAARDAAGGTSRSGNRSGDVNISFTIDKNYPVSNINIIGNLDEGHPLHHNNGWHGDGWYHDFVEVKLSITSGSELDDNEKIQYQVLGGDTVCPTTLSDPTEIDSGDSIAETINLLSDGISTLCYQAKDSAGNLEPIKKEVLKLDRTKPEYEILTNTINGSEVNGVYYIPSDTIKVDVYGEDEHSGYFRTRYDLFEADENWNCSNRIPNSVDLPDAVDSATQTLSLSGLSDGRYCMQIWVYDDVQNKSWVDINGLSTIHFAIDRTNLEILSIEFDKEAYKEGDIMEISVNIKNKGPVATGESMDQLYLALGFDRYTWQNHMYRTEEDVPNIEAGGTGTITIEKLVPAPGSDSTNPAYWTDDTYTVSSVLRMRNRYKDYYTNNGNYTFIIDNTDPTGSIEYIYYPDSGTEKDHFVTNDNSPILGGTCSDQNLDTVTLEIDGQSQIVVCDNNTWKSNEFSTLADGTYTATLTLLDKAGNETIETEDITIDTVPATAEHTYYRNGTEITDPIAYVQGVNELTFTSVYDDANPSSGLHKDVLVIFRNNDLKAYCSWNQSLTGGTDLNGTNHEDLNQPQEFTNCVASLDEGEYHVRHRVYDNATRSTAPKYNQHKEYTTLQFIVDTTPPVIADHDGMTLVEGETFPTDTVTLTDNYELNQVCATATDLDPNGLGSSTNCIDIDTTNYTGDQFSLADEIRKAIENWQGSPFTIIDLDVLPEGQYEISYYATDLAGNESDTQTFIVTIQDNVPTITIDPTDTEVTAGDDPIVLSTTTTNGNTPFTYQWTGDCTGTGEQTTFDPTTEGEYTCTVTVTDSDGDTSTDSIDIAVGAVAGLTDENTDDEGGNNNDGGSTGEALGVGTGYELTGEEGEEEEEEDDATTEDEKEVLGEDIISCDNPITLQGYLYLDKNKNDQMDEKEKGIADVNIRIYYIYEGNEITVDEITTDENGYWQTEVCPTEYFFEVNKEDLPKHLTVSEVLSLTISEDSNDPTEFNISATDTRNFWQKYWYLILIGAALLITTIYLILSRKEKEQPIQ